MYFKVGFLVAGLKGELFLQNVLKDLRILNRVGFQIHLVSSYRVKGTLDESMDNICNSCAKKDIMFRARDNLKGDDLSKCDVIFVAGWQFIIEEIDDRFFILHDSLLPRLRGFNPTVSALILGDSNIGVTAFKPLMSIDEGPIYGVECCNITYPITIAEAYKILGVAYGKLSLFLLESVNLGTLKETMQDSSKATYSLWRDEKDYLIDWSMSAEQISRFVDAVGWPYLGAKTTYQERFIRIIKVDTIDDLDFPLRTAGKIWTIGRELGFIDVVCGRGMLRIIDARDEDGRTVVFDKIRLRLGH